MANFYWRNPDGGLWNDLNNWRTTVDGTIKPSAKPTQTDIVYFDNESVNNTLVINDTTNIVIPEATYVQSFVNTSDYPFRIESDIDTQQGTAGRTLYVRPQTLDELQTSFDSLLSSNIHYIGNLMSITYYAINSGAIIPNINKTQGLNQFKKLSVVQFLSQSINSMVFYFDEFKLPHARVNFTGGSSTRQIRMVPKVGATVRHIEVGNFSHNYLLTGGIFDDDYLVSVTDEYQLNPAGNPTLRVPLSNSGVPYRTSIESYGNVPEMNINMGSAASSYYWQYCEINFHSAINQSRVVFDDVGGTRAASYYINNLTINGLNATNNIVEIVGVNTKRFRVKDNIVATRVTISKPSTTTTNNVVQFEGTYSITNCRLDQITHYSTTIDVINCQDVGARACVNINFISSGGEEEEVEVTSLFNAVSAYITNEAMVNANSQFEIINTNIETIKESIQNIESTFGEVVVEVLAIGQGGGGGEEEREVTSLFNEILTNATSQSITIGTRETTATVNNIETNITYAVIIPCDAEFGEVNCNITTTTIAKREYETTATFGEINARARAIILYRLPTKIVMEIRESGSILNFDETHTHFDETEGRLHLWQQPDA